MNKMRIVMFNRFYSTIFLAVLLVFVGMFPDHAFTQQVQNTGKSGESSLSQDNEALLANEIKVLKALKTSEKKASVEKAKVDQAAENAFKKMKRSIGRETEPPVTADSYGSAKASMKPVGDIDLVGKSSDLVFAEDLKPSAPRNTGNSNKKSKVASLRAENYSLQAQLTSAEERAQQLLVSLKRTRNQLMIAKSEIEMLNRVIEDRNIANLRGKAKKPVTARSTASNPRMYTKKTPKPDMPIATVIASKANLRAGPGRNNSTLMTVSKGTRLVVEKRVGKWYRVLTPNGTRAWISGSIVAFGKDSKSSPSRTLKIKSYDGNSR